MYKFRLFFAHLLEAPRQGLAFLLCLLIGVAEPRAQEKLPHLVVGLIVRIQENRKTAADRDQVPARHKFDPKKSGVLSKRSEHDVPYSSSNRTRRRSAGGAPFSRLDTRQRICKRTRTRLAHSAGAGAAGGGVNVVRSPSDRRWCRRRVVQDICTTTGITNAVRRYPTTQGTRILKCDSGLHGCCLCMLTQFSKWRAHPPSSI